MKILTLGVANSYLHSHWKSKLMVLILLLTTFVLEANSPKKIFSDIYKSGIWGKDQDGRGTSGAGATEQATEIYRSFLQQFLSDYQIESVVDLGCGDWEFSRLIDWKNIDYLGIDVVQSVVDRNNDLYKTKNINFIRKDGLKCRLPKADLLICKDVLQHISNESVFQIIKQFHRFKYCLITNEIDTRDAPPINSEIATGAYARPVDLTQPPFNLNGVKVLTYKADKDKQILFIAR